MSGRALRLAGAAAALWLLLVLPNHPGGLTATAMLFVPLELPAILLALVAAGQGAAARAGRVALTVALTALVVLKGADFATQAALARGFNPVADLALLPAAVRLLAGAVGPLAAVAAGLGVALAVALLAALVWRAAGVWAGAAQSARWLAAVAAVAAGGVMLADALRWPASADPPGDAFTLRQGIDRVRLARDTLAELRAFRARAATDPWAGAAGLFAAIDRDVVIVFIESYGRTSLDTPYFAEVHRATLTAAEARLAPLGFAMRSGIAAAPTRGGQSWLSHATLANGLWVSDQVRYGAALASGRQTLFHLARRAGFHTAAVMPQITLDWPESATMGFDTVLAARDLGYRGQPFNWVTMPDQFTLAAFDRLLRVRAPGGPRLFVQVVLSSSHAPWVPVPDLIDWDAVGDGRVFDAMAASGDPPEVVWRDEARIRAQYRLAIDYALRTVFDYLARMEGDPPLVIVLGDHQAAGFVALDERPDVPVHVLGPPHLVARAAAFAPHPGLIPPAEAPALPMDALRDRIIGAYSAPTGGG